MFEQIILQGTLEMRWTQPGPKTGSNFFNDFQVWALSENFI